MATIKFWQEMQRVVTIDGQDKLMIGKNSTGEAQYVNVEDLNQFLSIQGDSMPAIQGGSTAATAVALPAGPNGQNRFFDASWGYWKYNNVVLTNPNGVQGIPEGSEGILFWDGATQTWTISKVQVLPKNPPAKSYYFNNTVDAVWNYRANAPELSTQINQIFEFASINVNSDFKKSDGSNRDIYVSIADVNSGIYRLVINVQGIDGIYVSNSYSGASKRGKIIFDGGYLDFNLGIVPANATNPMSAAQGTLNLDFVNNAIEHRFNAVESTDIRKIYIDSLWTPRTGVVRPYRVADLFTKFDLKLTQKVDLSNRVAKIYINNIENVGGQFNIKISVEKEDGTYTTYNNTAGQTSSINISVGVIDYSFVSIDNLPVSNNIPITYEQGGLTVDYVNICNNSVKTASSKGYIANNSFFIGDTSKEWNYKTTDVNAKVSIEMLFQYIYLDLTSDFKKPDGSSKVVYIGYADWTGTNHRVTLFIEQNDGSFIQYSYSATPKIGYISFPEGKFHFGLGEVPTGATKPMVQTESSLNTDLILNAIKDYKNPVISTKIGKILDSQVWKPRTSINNFIRVADLFTKFDLVLNQDLKTGDRLRKIQIVTVENVSGNYLLRIGVENTNNQIINFTKTGAQEDVLDIGVGTVSYRFKSINELPISNNTTITHDQGGLTDEYLGICQNIFLSKQIAKSNNLVSYVNTTMVELVPPRFWMYKTIMSRTVNIKRIDFNGAKAGTKIRLIEVNRSGTLYNFVNKSAVIELDGSSDFIDVDFTVSQGNYIGLQLIEGIISAGSPIPAGVVRWESYRGDISDRDSLDSTVDTIVVAGDYILVGLSENNDALTILDKAVYYDNSIPQAKPYLRKYVNSSSNISYVGNPMTLSSPDGYDMFLHPQVKFFPDGLWGYKYWMCITPFPTNAPLYADYYEDPCMYASNNGLDWEEPAQNPIDTIGEEYIGTRGFMSDPSLTMRDGVMELWYRRSTINQTIDPNAPVEMLRKTTTDGVNWSARELMFTFSERDTFHMRAQSIIWDGTKYVAWYQAFTYDVPYDGKGNMFRAESVDGKIGWAETQSRVLGMTDTNNHPDVSFWDGKYYALLQHNSGSGSANYAALIVYDSVDGITWGNRKVILEKDDLMFYRDGFYKSTLVHNKTHFLVYFTANVTNKDNKIERKIGVMKGKTIDSLEVVDAKGNGNINVNGFLNLDCSDKYSAKIQLDKGKYLMYEKNRSMLVLVDDFGNTKPLLKI